MSNKDFELVGRVVSENIPEPVNATFREVDLNVSNNPNGTLKFARVPTDAEKNFLEFLQDVRNGAPQLSGIDYPLLRHTLKNIAKQSFNGNMFDSAIFSPKVKPKYAYMVLPVIRPGFKDRIGGYMSAVLVELYLFGITNIHRARLAIGARNGTPAHVAIQFQLVDGGTWNTVHCKTSEVLDIYYKIM